MNNTRLCIVILVAVLVCFTQRTNAQNTRGDPRGTIGSQDCGTWFDVRQAQNIDDGGRYCGRRRHASKPLLETSNDRSTTWTL